MIPIHGLDPCTRKFFNDNFILKSMQDSFQHNSIIIVTSHDVETLLEMPKEKLYKFARLSDTKIIYLNDVSNLERNNYNILKFIDYIVNIIMFDPKRIFIVLQNKLDKEKLNDVLNGIGISGMNISEYDIWLNYSMIPEILKFQKANVKATHRFSLFSRRMNDTRIALYFALIREDILKNCIYTFYHMHPDFQEDEKKYKDILISKISPIDGSSRKVFYEWIDNLPYTLGKNLRRPFDPIILKYMNSSMVNIIVETHFLPDNDGVTLTEKTWKPISIKKPFIMYGKVKNLEILRNLGFKTFHGLIDERYDKIEDPDIRRKKIIEQIKIINNFSDREIEKFVLECQPIVDHNFQLLLEYYEKPWEDNFYNIGIFKNNKLVP